MATNFNMDGFLNRSFGGPSTVQSLAQGVEGNAKTLSPHVNLQRFSFVGDDDIVPPVPLLLDRRGPATIVRGIRSIPVFSIKTMFQRWARSHVGEEVLKGVLPAFADDNPAPSVESKIGSSGIETSRFHAMPDVVLGRVPHAVFEGWAGPSGCPGSSITTAAFRVTHADGSTNNSCFPAAGTPTKPPSRVGFFCWISRNFFKDGQLSENLTRQIFILAGIVRLMALGERHETHCKQVYT